MKDPSGRNGVHYLRQNGNSSGLNLDLGSQETLGPSLGLMFVTCPSIVSEHRLHLLG